MVRKRDPRLALQELLCYLEDDEDSTIQRLCKEVVPLVKPIHVVHKSSLIKLNRKQASHLGLLHTIWQRDWHSIAKRFNETFSTSYTFWQFEYYWLAKHRSNFVFM